MAYQNILVEEQNMIVTLTINRAQAANALNQVTLVELKHFFEIGYKNFWGARGIIITGSGSTHFSGGFDLNELRGKKS